MARRALYIATSSVLWLGLTGCPVTDDYYLLSDDGGAARGGSEPGAGKDSASGSAGKGASGASTDGGKGSQAGSSVGGSSSAGTGMGGSSTEAGAPDPGQAGMPDGGTTAGTGGSGGTAGAGGTAGSGGTGGTGECVPATERCNGHDDNCNGVIDESACLTGCTGFVLPGSPDHGYMFCTSSRKANWYDAKMSCESQDMRLAWLTSAEENAAVATKLDALGSDAEVLFGATDMGNEGDWIWFGGEQFWKGAANGVVVGGRYNNWPDGTPNNAMNNEDCALIIVSTGAWGDRSCYPTYPYVCEQPD